MVEEKEEEEEREVLRHRLFPSLSFSLELPSRSRAVVFSFERGDGKERGDSRHGDLLPPDLRAAGSPGGS